MSRNGNGTYNLPAGNPVVTGTTISSTWANNTLADMANAITGSIAADGQTPITGALKGTNGTVAFAGVGQTKIPSGTTAQRAASPTDGMIRYNTDLKQYEGYKDGAWSIFGNGAGGTLFSDTVTATQGQTVIVLTTGYVLGGDNLSVYVNGSRQIYNVNYTETSTTSFTFTNGLNAGDLVNYTIGASTSLSVNAASVLYNEGATGAVNQNVESKLQEKISIKDFGAVGDSDGTTGNGTDNTVFIQNAINYAASVGKSLFIPAGQYRITGQLNFSGDTNQFGFEGESKLNSIIFADYNPATRTAVLSVNNSAGTRAYVRFNNFYLKGVNNANTVGIYCNWTSGFSEIFDVTVIGFYDGIVVSNDYNMKISYSVIQNCLNNGIQFGLDITGASGLCNNNLFLGVISDNNGASGLYQIGCRALQLCQCTMEANEYCNIFLDYVQGASITGQYMEYSPSIVAIPNAQLRIQNSNGVSVNGLSVSAFNHDTTPIIYLSGGNNGISLTGISIETTGGTFNAFGIYVEDSFGVSINNSFISNVTTGLYVNTASRISINDTDFNANTTPIATASVNATIYWNQAIQNQVNNSDISASSNVDIWYSDNTKLKINQTQAFNVSVAYSDLSSAAIKNLITYTLLSEQWRITDIFAVGLTAFSGGGGNRDLVITDGTSNYTIIPAASLQSATTQGRWGSTVVPYSVITDDMVQPTTAASNLYCAYSGGTTDYTAGIINLTIVAERVA